MVAAVRRLLVAGEPVDGDGRDAALESRARATRRTPIGSPSRRRCWTRAASTRRDDARCTALHAAAERGPLALVELLIRRGALEWQPDAAGGPAIDAARRGTAADRDAIVELLDRPVIRDPAFRAAVAALHAGDVAELERRLDAEPRLVRERIVEPGCYRAAVARSTSSTRSWSGSWPTTRRWSRRCRPTVSRSHARSSPAAWSATTCVYTLGAGDASAPAREQGHQSR